MRLATRPNNTPISGCFCQLVTVGQTPEAEALVGWKMFGRCSSSAMALFCKKNASVLSGYSLIAHIGSVVDAIIMFLSATSGKQDINKVNRKY